MNTMIKAASLLLAGLCITSSSDVPKGAKLRLDLPVGKKVQMEADMNMNYYSDKKLTDVMMTTHIVINSEYTVLAKSDGLHSLKYSIERMRLNQNMAGQEMVYDSDSPDQENPMAMAMDQQFAGTINQDIKLKVNELGKVVEQDEIDDPTISQSTEQLFIEFPEKDLKTGDEWQQNMSNVAADKTVEMTLAYKVKEITKQKITVNVSIVPNSLTIDGEKSEDISLEQAGTMVFDLSTGQLLNSEVNQTMTMKNPQTGEDMFMVNTVSMKTKS